MTIKAGKLYHPTWPDKWQFPPSREDAVEMGNKVLWKADRPYAVNLDRISEDDAYFYLGYALRSDMRVVTGGDAALIMRKADGLTGMIWSGVNWIDLDIAAKTRAIYDAAFAAFDATEAAKRR